jgi:hypothetical protein
MTIERAFTAFKKIFKKHSWLIVPLVFLFLMSSISFVYALGTLIDMGSTTWYGGYDAHLVKNGDYGKFQHNKTAYNSTSDATDCSTVTNTSSSAYFVPTKTKVEWDAFQAAVAAGKVSGIHPTTGIGSCCAANQGQACNYTGTCVQGQYQCDGTTCGATVSNIANNTDPYNECSALTCANYVYGWSGNTCQRYSASTASNGMCNGSGACYTSYANSCGTPAQNGTAVCGSAGCRKSCPAGGAASSYDTVAEACYTSGESCGTGYACNSSGTCVATNPCDGKPNGTSCGTDKICGAGTCRNCYHPASWNEYSGMWYPAGSYSQYYWIDHLVWGSSKWNYKESGLFWGSTTFGGVNANSNVNPDIIINGGSYNDYYRGVHLFGDWYGADWVDYFAICH